MNNEKKTALELLEKEVMKELLLWGKHFKLQNKHLDTANKLAIKWKKLIENGKN